jgi:hypothetical protein
MIKIAPASDSRRVCSHIMKLALVAVTCSTSAASAKDLDKNEQSFVAITAAAPIVAGMCDTRVVPAAFVAIGDRLGVDDSSGLFKGTLAAMDALGHRDYKRGDLKPAVTRFVGELADSLAEEFSEDKPEACKKYLEVLRASGAVE